MGTDWKVLGNEQEAKKAIREMNGATIAGQEIKVKREALYFKLFLFSAFLAFSRMKFWPFNIK